MSKFYTNVSLYKNNIRLIGYEDGKRIQCEIPYKPYLFYGADGDTKYKNIKGKPVMRRDFDSVSEARKYMSNFEDVGGMDVYGLDKFIYPFIFDNYKRAGDIDYDPSLVSVVSIDIEVSIAGGKGFPDIQVADNPVTLITISRNGRKAVFGCGEFNKFDENGVDRFPDVTYYKCLDEAALLRVFLEIWGSSDYNPDIVTGWNVEFFDIPYLVNRITRVLGGEMAKRLSPWGYLQEKTVEILGNPNQVFVPVGLSILDYIQLYKKFAFKQQESYKLDHIAHDELGERKLEVGSLADLEVNNWQLYTEYNIHDVVLVDRLDDKLKLIELVMAMAYDAGTNYADAFTSVGMWDVIIHNNLMRSNTVIPQFKKVNSDRTIVGGYVKEVQVGMHKWVISLDLNSLYPHIIMQYNISPEMLVGKFPAAFSVDNLLDGFLNENDRKSYLTDNNYTVAANMCVFSKRKQGFLAAIMQKMYEDRVVYKKKMIEAKQAYEKCEDKNSPEAIQLVKDISRYDNLQMAKKIQLNSGYGALANEWNRWFNNDIAEAITMSGQLSTKWIERKLNQYLNKLLGTSGVDYVIASDTDSVYINVEQVVNKMCKETDTKAIVAWLDAMCEKALEPYIDKCYAELADYMNAYDQKMKMKRECIADKGIWTATKRYILNVYNQEGVEYAKPKLKMVGIEAVRTSTPAVVRAGIKDALELIMSKEESDLQKFIADFRESFIQLPFEQVAFPRGVKNLRKYQDRTTVYVKGCPINVKGALVYNHLLKKYKVEGKYEAIADSQKIKYAYLKKSNPAMSTVIACPEALPVEFNLDKYIDKDMQFEKSFLDPIKTIVHAIGWETEKRATLEDLFNF